MNWDTEIENILKETEVEEYRLGNKLPVFFVIDLINCHTMFFLLN